MQHLAAIVQSLISSKSEDLCIIEIKSGYGGGGAWKSK
jgi:hypothetical protein